MPYQLNDNDSNYFQLVESLGNTTIYDPRNLEKDIEIIHKEITDFHKDIQIKTSEQIMKISEQIREIDSEGIFPNEDSNKLQNFVKQLNSKIEKIINIELQLESNTKKDKEKMYILNQKITDIIYINKNVSELNSDLRIARKNNNIVNILVLVIDIEIEIDKVLRLEKGRLMNKKTEIQKMGSGTNKSRHQALEERNNQALVLITQTLKVRNEYIVAISKLKKSYIDLGKKLEQKDMENKEKENKYMEQKERDDMEMSTRVTDHLKIYPETNYDFSNLDNELELLTSLFSSFKKNDDFTEINLTDNVDNIVKLLKRFLPESLQDDLETNPEFSVGPLVIHKFIELINILVPYENHKTAYGSYQYLFNSLFSNLRINKIINETYLIIKSDTFNTDRKKSLQNIESIINKYIGDIFSSKEIISFILFVKARGPDMMNLLSKFGGENVYNKEFDEEYIRLDDYSIKFQDILNNSKIPVKYIIMYNVFLQNMVALVLQNFDEHNEIVNILSLLVRGLNTNNNMIIMSVLENALQNTLKDSFRSLQNLYQNQKIRSIVDMGGGLGISGTIYKVFVDDGIHLVVKDETIFRDHFRTYIELLPDSMNNGRERIVDVLTLEKSNELKDIIKYLKNMTGLKLDDFLKFACENKDVNIIEYLNKNNFHINNDDFISFIKENSKPLSEIYSLVNEVELFISENNLEDIKYPCETIFMKEGNECLGYSSKRPCNKGLICQDPNKPDVNITSCSSGSCKCVDNSSKINDIVLPPFKTEGFTNVSTSSINKVLNVFIVINLIVLLIVGYFYYNKNNDSITLTDTPDIDFIM